MTQKVAEQAQSSERLLALYPNLPFDRGAAKQVLIDKVWPAQAEALEALPANASFLDLLATFRHEASREEFLWHYIEAVTGEEGLCNKEY